MQNKDIISSANAMSPEPLLRSRYGKDVRVKGNHISVKGVLRADYKNGRWVACDWIGAGIGGTVSIIAHTYGVGFRDAVEMITGIALSSQDKPIPNRRDHVIQPITRRAGGGLKPDVAIQIPDLISSYEPGRAYLRSRGIQQETLIKCEMNGSLGYTDSGVAFIGRNASRLIRYIAIRYYENQIDEDGSDFNKKDAVGSSKEYCFCIPPSQGSDYSTYLVEGGVNALSLHDILSRNGVNAFILTTGSVSARKWMHNEDYIDLIRKSERCIMVGENETASKNRTAEQKQKQCDLARYSVLSDLSEIVQTPISIVYPPKEFGDINDYLKSVIINDREADERCVRNFVQSTLDAEALTATYMEDQIERLSHSELKSFIPPGIAKRKPCRKKPFFLRDSTGAKLEQDYQPVQKRRIQEAHEHSVQDEPMNVITAHCNEESILSGSVDDGYVQKSVSIRRRRRPSSTLDILKVCQRDLKMPSP